jgi:lysyl-tRNA synthetase, class I
VGEQHRRTIAQEESRAERAGNHADAQEEEDVPIVAQSTETTDWVSRYADEVVAEWERRARDGKSAASVITVASGLSP